MAVTLKFLSLSMLGCLLSAQTAFAQNISLMPQLSQYKVLGGSSITVSTGDIMPRKVALSRFDVLIDGNVVASSPPNPPALWSTIDAGWGIEVPDTYVHYAPVTVPITEGIGTHSVTLTLYYSDGSKETGNPNYITVVPQNPLAHTALQPPPSAANRAFNPGTLYGGNWYHKDWRARSAM